MDKKGEKWEEICARLCAEDPEVEPGKMMSAPGLKWRGKVFAFYHEGCMTFKLGMDFDPEAFGLREFSWLSPFTHKPPMKAWFVIPNAAYWEDLADLALKRISKY